MKQREVKKPSFPDFGFFGVPPAFRPPKPRFAGFAAIYLFFMIFIFCFYHYNLILRTAQSLQSFLSGTRCLQVIIYICIRSSQSFYFSVYDDLVVSNQIVGCIPVDIFVGYRFKSIQTFRSA